MKQIKWIMAGALAIALCSPAAADDKKADAPKPKRVALTKEIGLSKDQLKKYRAATKELNAKGKEIQGNKDLNKKDKRTKMREIQEKRISALKEICTDEQKKKLEDVLAKRKAAGKKKKDK